MLEKMMQKYEPEPEPSIEELLSVEYFISILAILFVLALIILMVKSVMGMGMGLGSDYSTEKKSIKKSNMCGNCKIEPIYDNDSGLCRYCVKYI